MNKTYFTLMALFILSLTVTGCAQSSAEPSIGQIQKDLPAVKVSELLSNPDSYKGKMVVLAGVVADACPGDGCYFDLNDGTGTINIDLKESKLQVFPQKKGASVKVYGEFIFKGSKPYVNARKIEL